MICFAKQLIQRSMTHHTLVLETRLLITSIRTIILDPLLLWIKYTRYTWWYVTFRLHINEMFTSICQQYAFIYLMQSCNNSLRLIHTNCRPSGDFGILFFTFASDVMFFGIIFTRVGYYCNCSLYLLFKVSRSHNHLINVFRCTFVKQQW